MYYLGCAMIRQDGGRIFARFRRYCTAIPAPPHTIRSSIPYTFKNLSFRFPIICLKGHK